MTEREATAARRDAEHSRREAQLATDRIDLERHRGVSVDFERQQIARGLDREQ